MSIFEQPRLAKALFGWPGPAELIGLLGCIGRARNGRGLDVGCGYGRLLTPLRLLGLQVDGLDISRPLLDEIVRDLGDVGADGRDLMCSAMQAFATQRRYSFAFSAMNSVRYLLTREEFEAHLDCVANCVTPGGVYLFSLTLSPDDDWAYDRTWLCSIQGRPCRVRWTAVRRDRASSQVVDKVVLSDAVSGERFHVEEQPQFDWSPTLLCSVVFRRHPRWLLESVVDPRFAPVSLHSSSKGNFWIVLRRYPD